MTSRWRWSSRSLRPALIAVLVLAGPSAAAAAPVHTERIGRSVRGTPIRAYRVGPPNAPRTVLVVGEIHGNERAGEAVTRRLMHAHPPPDGVALWLIPELNPDGARSNTRQNAHGVDLNRNFDWRWRRSGHRGEIFWPGPRAFSAPESRAAKRLILRIRPRVAIWYHQHLALVDEASGGNVRIERRYARLVGLPSRRLPRYRGEAVGWENKKISGGTAFVVELTAGPLSDAAQHEHALAVMALARSAAPGR
jgi:murein peptide amidase A